MDNRFQGLGVALIPDLILRSASHPDVVTLPTRPASRRAVHIVTTTDLERVPAVRATIDALVEAAGGPLKPAKALAMPAARSRG